MDYKPHSHSLVAMKSERSALMANDTQNSPVSGYGGIIKKCMSIVGTNLGNNIARRLGWSPVEAAKSTTKLLNQQDKQSWSDESRYSINDPTCTDLEKCCHKLMECSLPEKNAPTRLIAFKGIVMLATRYPGLRKLFIRFKRLMRLKGSKRTVLTSAPVESKRFRSRSSRTPLILGPAGSRRSPSRSPRVIMAPSSQCRRSRSISPRTIIIPAPVESRRSRSRSPRVNRIAETHYRRSRSRSPPTIMVAPTQHWRSRSRSPRTVIMEAPHESRRSHSPRKIFIPAPSTYRRSRSPTRMVIGNGHSRSRSHSRERRRLVRTSRRSRSRSPIIIQQPRTYRHRSRSPQPVTIGEPSELLYSRRTIIHGGDGRSSPRRFMSRVFGGQSRSPNRIFVGSRRHSRSPPPIIETGGPYSRSRSPRRHVLAKSRSRTPPVIIDADRPRSYSPRRRYREISHERSRTPPVIITGSRRNWSRSPRRLESRHSRSPVRIYEGNRRDHQSRSRSRSSRRRYSYSPCQRRSYSPRDWRSYSPWRRHEGSYYDPVELDAGTRRHRGYSPRRSRSPFTRRLSHSPERNRGSRRGSWSPNRYSDPSPPRHRPSLFGHTASLFGRGSRADPVDYDRGRHRQSSPGTRITHRSPSPDEFDSPAEIRAPRTHQSGRPNSPITVLVRDDDYEPIIRPATRESDVLSTIHEGDIVRTSPSIIQVPHGHWRHTPLRVASPGLTTGPIGPTIIHLPGGETSCRITPQILRIGTAGSETPSNIIRLPSAPPQIPSRAQVLRVGVADQSIGNQSQPNQPVMTV